MFGLALERMAFCLRKRAEREADTYFPSLSARTLVYKGMLTTAQLEPFFPDLSDRRYVTELALVHSRFSTNTFPSWPLAHPYRLIAHNGEINTVRGNRNWMAARESQLASDVIPGDLSRLLPICTPGASDSATFDEVLELLHLGGRSLPHAVLMMIPEAWENHAEMDPARRAFYEFHAALMEPWDGPACITFTDGSLIGAVLDRNGLRPSRYWVTEDGLVVLASEVGVLDLDPATVVRKGRLQPGRMFLVDTDRGRIVDDAEIKAELAAEAPYDEWLHAGQIHLADLPEREHVRPHPRQRHPAAADLRLHRGGAADPAHADGPDRRRADRLDGHRHPDRGAVRAGRGCCSTTSASCSPRSPTRRWTRSARSSSPASAPRSARTRTCSPRRPRTAVRWCSTSRSSTTTSWPRSCTSTGTATCRASPRPGSAGSTRSPAADRRCSDASSDIFAEVSEAVAAGARFIVLSDRDSDADWAPIPSLLLTAPCTTT